MFHVTQELFRAAPTSPPHPIAFDRRGEPLPRTLTLLNRQLTLVGRTAVLDRCSHRGAKLSQGRLIKNGKIECPYHGWTFDSQGQCVNIPQLEPGRRIPQACHLAPQGKLLKHDGIVWLVDATNPSADDLHPAVKAMDWASRKDVWITDHVLDAPYSFLLQMENLLDPAHIHFVHDGFQGNRQRASPLEARFLENSASVIAAAFAHPAHLNVPEIHIQYYWPSVVDVSILNKRQEVVRKNIIYAMPATDTTCRVLFRDVLFKDHLVPDGSLAVQEHVRFMLNMLGEPFAHGSYDVVSSSIVAEIMDQDVEVLKAQQANVGADAWPIYVMPTQSDMLITEFRRRCRALLGGRSEESRSPRA